MKRVLIIISILSIYSCTNKVYNISIEKEVYKVEEDFKNMSAEKGIAQAFYNFAAEDAVIKRENDSLIKGKEAIKNYYSNPRFSKASVTWEPDFVNISKDGTLAYTYGKYIWTTTDNSGNKKEYKGIFHTVWKKQKDGKWKYVWD